MFPLNCQWVPIRFPLCPQVPNVVPNIFSIAPRCYPICFGRCSSPFSYTCGPKGRNSMLQNRTFHFGEPLKFHFFWVAGQWNWLHHQKRTLNFGGTSLINRRGLSLSITIWFHTKHNVPFNLQPTLTIILWCFQDRKFQILSGWSERGRAGQTRNYVILRHEPYSCRICQVIKQHNSL
jgi:hypothetical protein